jgi:UDP-glucuronate 4-epimerase
MKRILLTGGAGFIGSNLTQKLLADNHYHVTCVDNFDSFYSREQKEDNISRFIRHPNYTLIEGDIRSYDDLDRAGHIDIIIHLAAKAGVRPSIQNPFQYHDVNVTGTQNVLEFAKKRNVKQFIQASSSSVYGTNINVPWHEEEKLFPISPYASSKLSDEMLGHVYAHLYGIRFIALRFFTVYGPRQRPDLAIYKFFDGLPVTMFGNGDSFRDYTFIDDIVNGIESAITYHASGYEIINIGCGNPVTLINLIGIIESICGKKAIIDRQPMQPGDVAGTFADITKAQKLLDYQPLINLDEGLRIFYDWLLSSKKELPISR